jgi:hypothetical protein
VSDTFTHEPDFDGNPAEVAARKRIAEARAWQWQAGLRGDLCEYRSATAALQRACDELLAGQGGLRGAGIVQADGLLVDGDVAAAGRGERPPVPAGVAFG